MNLSINQVNKRVDALFVLGLLLMVPFTTFSQTQNEVETHILTRFEEFNEQCLKEKIYVHVDKPFYIQGETVWYKAYLVNVAGNAPILSDEIIYIELVDIEGEVISRQMIQSRSGLAKGEFTLPENLLQGNYRLVAYTNWMRNFDQELFFSKVIPVYDLKMADNNLKAVEKETDPKPIDLQFFPEGGDLVTGLESKVAFKAINSSGKGVEVRGDIIDQNGNPVTSFESFHLGMGAFYLTPEKGKDYFASLIPGDSQKVEIPLPVAISKGIVMSVDNSSFDDIEVLVEANEPYLAKTGKLFLVMHTSGKILYSSIHSFSDKSSFLVSIPKGSLPSGVAKLTLFDTEGRPECERLIFIKPHNTLQVKIGASQETYQPREKVFLEVSVKDKEGKPVEGSFSLSATDAGQVGNIGKHCDNILSNLLLTSEVKGVVEQPGYYFSKDNSESGLALDHLMLTQGWRRYAWKEILEARQPFLNFRMEKNNILRKGQIFYKEDSIPVASSLAAFLIVSEVAPYSAYTDRNGFYKFYLSPIYGNEYVFCDILTENGEHPDVTAIIGNRSPEYFLSPELPWINESLVKSYLNKRIDRARIETSFNYNADHYFYDSASSEFEIEPVDTRINMGPPDYSVRLDKYVLTSMKEVLREVATHVRVRDKKGETLVRIYSDDQLNDFDYQPLFFVDGIPTFNQQYVLNIQPNDVDVIDVYASNRKISDFGFFGKNGVISIYTKSKNTTLQSIPENNFIQFVGFHISKEFYVPDNNYPDLNRSKPDLRSLIYWNPEITTDSNGTANVSFYNTDNITTVEVKLEGISTRGIPGIGNYSYEVILKNIE